MTQTIKLSERLAAAASLVRDGAFVADVGTDHAYLPLWLLLEEKIRGGVVSDIHQGPLERARSHIRLYGVEDRLTPVLCDGLKELESYCPEDIFILGMGGELIARMIREVSFPRQSGVRLILQPMTHPEILRRFLWENGYTVETELLVKEKKIYQILQAKYTGNVESFSELELYFGKLNLEKGGCLLEEALNRTEAVLRRRMAGKQTVNGSAEEEERLLSQIDAWRKGKHHDR